MHCAATATARRPLRRTLNGRPNGCCKVLARWWAAAVRSWRIHVTRRAEISLGLFVGMVATLAVAPVWAQEKYPERNTYFGETHVHTSWSLDAFAIGNTLTNPGDAYK